jgi:hypothetical protein
MLATRNDPEDIQAELKFWRLVQHSALRYSFVNPDNMYAGYVVANLELPISDLPSRRGCFTACAKIPYGPNLVFVTDTPEAALALVRDTPTHVLRAVAKLSPDSYISPEMISEA